MQKILLRIILLDFTLTPQVWAAEDEETVKASVSSFEFRARKNFNLLIENTQHRWTVNKLQ